MNNPDNKMKFETPNLTTPNLTAENVAKIAEAGRPIRKPQAPSSRVP
jgi:hypothetical protein